MNENSNVMEFCRNTQALRVINSTCSNVKVNCQGSVKNKIQDSENNASLPKRRSKVTSTQKCYDHVYCSCRNIKDKELSLLLFSSI